MSRLRLRALTLGAVGTLAAGTACDVAALHRSTGGNPFFVIEMLGAGGTALPATLRDAVLARAARLTPAGRRGLDAAAVLGSRFPPAFLAAVGVDDEAVAECLTSGALVRDHDIVAFRHELSRAAILDALLPARAVELHALALGAWRRSSHTPDALAALAHHAEAAGDGAGGAGVRAACGAPGAALRAHREAAEQYARALRWAHDLAPRDRAALFEERSYECYLTGQMEAALAARGQALEIWRAEGDPARIGDCLRWQSRLSWWLGRRAEAEAQSGESIAVLEAAGPGPQLAWAFAHASQIAMLAARREEAIAWGARAIELAERLGEREVLCHALNNVGTARYDLDEGPEGTRELERSLALAFELEKRSARRARLRQPGRGVRLDPAAGCGGAIPARRTRLQRGARPRSLAGVSGRLPGHVRVLAGRLRRRPRQGRGPAAPTHAGGGADSADGRRRPDPRPPRPARGVRAARRGMVARDQHGRAAADGPGRGGARRARLACRQSGGGRARSP